MLKLFFLLLIISCSKPTIYPTKGEVIEAVYGLGIIKSENNYSAKAAIVSSVREFYVVEGQDVVKGQKLFITDQGSIHSAPFAGQVNDIPVNIGENLFPQTLVLNVVDLSNLYLEVSLEQQGAMKLSKGMKAEISFEFFRNKKLIGSISTIYPRNDQFIAKVLIEEWPKGVLPGMSADVAFEVARKEDVILLPVKVVTDGYIEVIRNKKKEKIKVELGLIDQEKVEILSPILSLDEKIIIP